MEIKFTGLRKSGITTMECITLVENSSNQPQLKEEFGLSILVRCDSGNVLFDMGASSCFADNSEILGIDLGTIDCAVVSHGHYDHGGGLETFSHHKSLYWP